MSSSPSKPETNDADHGNSTTDNDNSDDRGEILILSDYPFYVKGAPPSEVAKVAEDCKKLLQEVCGSQLVSVDRMGSTAIDGLAGTPVCDMLAQLSPWPLSAEAKAKLLELGGYECKGKAPHNSQGQDEWYFGGIGKPGHLGRVVLHTVPEGCDMVQDMKAFIAYVKSHPDAFRRYEQVKINGAREMLQSQSQDGRLLGYKKKKEKVCNEIKQEAIEWWKKQQQEQSSLNKEAKKPQLPAEATNGKRKHNHDEEEEKPTKTEEEDQNTTTNSKQPKLN